MLEVRSRTNRDRGQGNKRTTAVRDYLVVWGERCAWADLAAVGCESIEWLGLFPLSGLQIWNVGLEGFPIYLLISLSWYCDCAVEEAVEAEPLEAVGDDILFRCRFGRDEEGKVRSGPCEDGRCV